MNTFTKLTSALVLGLSFCMAGNATETTDLQELETAYKEAQAAVDDAGHACREAAYKILNTPTNMQFLRMHAEGLQKYSDVRLLQTSDEVNRLGEGGIIVRGNVKYFGDRSDGPLDGKLYDSIRTHMRDEKYLTLYEFVVFAYMTARCTQAFHNAGPAYEAYKRAVEKQTAAWEALWKARQAAKTAKEE